MNKTERYKWVVRGEPGELKYIDKSALHVDQMYQRVAKNARVLKLAREWNWLSCGTLIVVKRDGVYYVIDGQHRLLAAMKRDDIAHLPCLVFGSTEPEKEAVAFLEANRERRPINSFEQWKANLVARDESTLFAASLLEIAGRAPSDTTGPGSVRCLAKLVAAARMDRAALRRVWPLLMQLCEGRALHQRILEALFYIECHLVEGQSLCDRVWYNKAIRIGAEGMLDAIHRASVFYSAGGAKVWALGVLEVLNKGNRTRTLELRS